MKKGIITIYVPVGNLEGKKIKKFIKKEFMSPMKKAIKQIKKSGFIVLMFPSREKKELQLEFINF